MNIAALIILLIMWIPECVNASLNVGLRQSFIGSLFDTQLASGGPSEEHLYHRVCCRVCSSVSHDAT